jgi:tetratricopeptide (TPR) repeat protein
MKLMTRKQRFRELASMWKQELFAGVIESAKEYLKDFPNSETARLYYGVSLYKLARYEEAKKTLLQVIKECDPEHHAYLYSHMGHLYERKGEFQKATEWHRKAIKIDSREAAYRIFLGAVLAQDGKLAEAEECHRQATKCKTGDFSEAYLNLGYVLRAQEKYKKALTCFEKALELDPKYKEAKHAIKDIKKVLELKQRKS